MKLKLSQIVITPDRQRKTFDEDRMRELVDSIQQVGQIEPVVVEPNDDGSFTLLAGERRMRAHERLGLTEIEAVTKECLDPWHRAMIQLEENIRREDLTWQDRANAVAEAHKLLIQRDGAFQKRGGWSIRDTAEKLNTNPALVSIECQLAEAIQTDPEIAKKETREAAYKALQIKKELNTRGQLAEVFASISASKGEEPISIINGDSREELKKFGDETFDFCITDIPYGIGFHDMQQNFPNRGEVRQGVEFDDASTILKEVVKPVMVEVYRLLKPSSHCYVFHAYARAYETKQILEECGFWVQATALFWIKNNALNLKPHIQYPVNYEPIFYCAKSYPPRPFSSIQLKSTFDHPILSGQTKVHPTEKPLPLIKQLIEICSQPKERGIDPFLGGGTFTLALKETDRLGVGIELDSNWWLSAKIRLEGGEPK